MVDGIWQRSEYSEYRIMSEERVPKKLPNSQIGGTQRRGRPRERRRDEVEEDVGKYLKSNICGAKIDQAMGLLARCANICITYEHI